MISFTSRQKYYFYSGPMDMRKDIDTLTEGVLVTKMQIKEDTIWLLNYLIISVLVIEIFEKACICQKKVVPL